MSWTTRATSDTARPKYVNAKPDEELLPAKSVLYGADLCRHACIAVEGPADAWRIGPGAAATLGVGYSRAQLRRLSQFAVRVVCFDNEPRAQERAEQLCRDLSCFPGKTMRVEIDAADPGSASKHEVAKLRKAFL